MFSILFILFFLNNNISNNKTNLFNSGYDERFALESDNTNDIINIEKNINKYELLKKLKNPNISIIKKKEYLESHYDLNKIKPAKLSGGNIFKNFL